MNTVSGLLIQKEMETYLMVSENYLSSGCQKNFAFLFTELWAVMILRNVPVIRNKGLHPNSKPGAILPPGNIWKCLETFCHNCKGRGATGATSYTGTLHPPHKELSSSKC